MQAAVFSDVEGTLIDGSLPRIFFQVGMRRGLFTRWQKAQIYALGALSKILPGKLSRALQFLLLARATAGHTLAEIDALGDEMNDEVKKRMKPASLARLKAHQEAGLPVILVSAGLHQGIARIAQGLGARGEGTKMVVVKDRYTDRLDGQICQGEGKAERVRQIIAEMGYNPAVCYAYGDTISDLQFLALFGKPHAVDPDPKLAEEAQKRGWPILNG